MTRPLPWRLLLRLQLALWMLLAFALTLRNGYLQSLTLHRGSVADWLISYPGEFVRRGFGGELLWQLQQLSGLPMAWGIFLIAGLCYAVLTLVSLRLIPRLDRLDEWLLLVSPATLFFPAYQLGAMGRKEVLLLIVPALMLWRQMSEASRVPRPPSLPFFLALLAWLTMLLLLHEGLLFIMPLLGLFLWQAWGDAVRVRWYLATAAAWLGLVFVIIALLSLRTPPDVPAICALLATRGAEPPGCAEPLMTSVSWLTVGPGEVWHLMAEGFTSRHALSILAGLLFCALPMWRLAGLRHPGWRYALALAATLPLFVLAIDWGRWLYVISTLSLFLHVQYRLRQPVVTPAPTGADRRAFLLTSALLLVWITGWQLQQCCLMGAGSGVLTKVMALLVGA